MPALNLPLLATIIPLFPVFYFAMASLTFFLRRFDDPVVTWLLRGLFNVYFLALCACCLLAAAVFASTGLLTAALAIARFAACALAARLWFLPRLDATMRARDTGDAGATRRLRRLHVGGIAYNALQCAAMFVHLRLVLALDLG